MKKFKFKLWADKSGISYRSPTKESLGILELEWEQDDVKGAWNKVYDYRERSNRIRARKYQPLIGDIDLLEETV